MRERYLQSLAILLAGLFAAERSRSKEETAAPPPPSAGSAPSADAADRSKAN